MRLHFGTDGVRAEANTQLTVDEVLVLARAAARTLGGDRVVVGRDTRHSGPMIEAALAAGFAAEGVNVELLGVLPTPAIAYISEVEQVPAAAITASHNPFADNGVKFFAPGGRKLSDDIEQAIEHGRGELGVPVISGAAVGTIRRRDDASVAYLAARTALFTGDAFAGIRVVVDCANGAMTAVGPELFHQLGADVIAINAEPDGTNINERCGATHPQELAAAVVEHGAALGVAFDGDGDRLIAVAHDGTIVDGDRIIALLAADMKSTGRLHDNAVVVTVMSNLGFRLAMQAAGIRIVETAVGDRYVLEALEAHSLSIGGEQSGHVILRDLATTGDGLLAAAALVDVVRRSGKSLADLSAAAMTTYPQVLVNVHLPERPASVATLIAAEIAAVEQRLEGRGRVLIRPSGTEPLIRVMVEAESAAAATAEADYLADAIRLAVGA